MFVTILVTAFLAVLLAPSWVALIIFGRLTIRQALRKGWPVWIGQIVVAVAWIFLADAVGLTNPLGYTFGICTFVGVCGAAFLWRTILARRL